MYSIEKMSIEHAKTIANWKYPEEYTIYSFYNDSETLHELMTEKYYACLDQENKLVGYFCFGKAAQIPTVEDNVYNDNMLDIGLGLAPELCGQKSGSVFLEAGMEYAKANFGTVAFRLSVANFNIRAIKVYEKVGFISHNDVTHKKSGRKFKIMVHESNKHKFLTKSK